MPRRKKGGRSRRNPTANTNDLESVRSHRTVGAGNNNLVQADLVRKPLNPHITQTPPRIIQQTIHWFTTSVNANTSVSASADVEQNSFFSLAGSNIGSQIAGLFDQYCIYSVTVSFVPPASALTSVSALQAPSLGRLITAIDYDNTNNLGSEAALNQYASVNTTEVSIGCAVQRFVKPCVDSSLFVSSLSSGFAPSRLWVDTSNTSVPHYGLRAYYTGATVAYSMNLFVNYVIGGRNGI